MSFVLRKQKPTDSPHRHWKGSPQICSSVGGPFIPTVTAIYQKYINHWLTLRCVYSCEIHLLAQLWQHYSSCFADNQNNAHIQIRWLGAALFMFTSHWRYEHVHSAVLEKNVNEWNNKGGQNLYGDFPTEFGYFSRICFIFMKSTEEVVSQRRLLCFNEQFQKYSLGWHFYLLSLAVQHSNNNKLKPTISYVHLTEVVAALHVS